ncbi:zinc finger protein 37-like isoform X2 [Toxorhynchites rutilus septentrionalis]|uniref:zinc finger protein 37-like isoform X2 n=1 Tax=Toxorhynchites rutilus septentrionalis TaxID=329112 RepID=UPI002478A739|nr:zinc finger protein 37-like isoform X2 [Toxorhynchites rutilus septentrionalis]
MENMSVVQQNYVLDMDLEEMCRICLSQTDVNKQLFNIFSSTIVDGFLVAVPDVIMFCVELQILETDGLPNKICECCRGQLLKFYIFKQKCKRTEEVLRKAFPSEGKENSSVLSKHIGGSSEEIVEMLDSEQQDEDASVDECDMLPFVDKYQCELCDDVYSSEERLRDHSKKHLDLIEENAESPEDITEFVNHENDKDAISDLNNFTLSEEKNNVQDNNIIEDLNSNVCDDPIVVGAPNLTEDGPVEHESNTLSNDLMCKICKKTFKKRSLHLKHMKSHESGSNLIEFFTYHTCEFCRKVFLSEKELLDRCKANGHINGVAVADQHTPYSCGNCSSEYEGFDHIRQHLLSHMSAFPCPFDGCGSEYTSSTRLETHICNKHIEYESHKCTYCGVDSLGSMIELQQHLRVNCPAKKFHCNHCDKKFLTSRSLAQHLRCLEKKHSCEECGKTFAQQGELKLHLRMHNGERPFQCTICGKRYKTASLRTAHMDSHINGKTFQCQICGKKLQSRTCYRNHIRRHSEEKQHGCDICNKKFYTKYNVKIHKEKVHKINQ